MGQQKLEAKFPSRFRFFSWTELLAPSSERVYDGCIIDDGWYLCVLTKIKIRISFKSPLFDLFSLEKTWMGHN